MFKEDGRLKPISEQELAKVRQAGKDFECGLCGCVVTRYKVEFSEQPRCPKCNKGLMVEKIC